MIGTALTQMLGIDHPVLCGGMTGLGTAELVGPVAESGALGFLTALTQPSAEALESEIRRTRDMTDKVFGVNLTLLPTIDPIPYSEYRAAIIESGVTVVETAGASPVEHLPEFQAAGVKVIHKATSVRHALSAERAGVDVVSIDGFECAGHPGEDDVPGLVLIPAAVDALTVPVVASGGVADARGLVAALALGACGVNMGTRFMATQEAPIHPNVKAQIVSNSELDTTLVFRNLGNTARVARNSISEEIAQIGSRADARFEHVAHLASGVRGRREVLGEGRMDGGMWWAGQVQGLIHDVPTVAELVATLVSEATALIEGRLASSVSGTR